MKYRKKRFLSKDIYNLHATDSVFVKAMIADIAFHMQHCPDYKNVLESLGFDVNSIYNMDDLSIIPLNCTLLTGQKQFSKTL